MSVIFTPTGGVLFFFSPVVNMARDPRWGRTQETYGEDPFLTSRLGVAFVRGLQGDDPLNWKTISVPKHFVANNEEHNRFECDAVISERTLREYYLPAFKACVVEGGAGGVMAAYNAVNGEPCHSSKRLLGDILRGEWGFEGFVVSDAGGVQFLHSRQKTASSPEDAVVQALKAGVDLELHSTFYPQHLREALDNGKLSENEVKRAVSRVLKAFRRIELLGAEELSCASIKSDVIGSKKHRDLALRAARESIVLLKNDQKGDAALLPVDFSKQRSVAVLGNNAGKCLFGHYSGHPVTKSVAIPDALRASFPDLNIESVEYECRNEGDFQVMRSLRIFSDTASESSGFLGEYFTNPRLESAPAFKRVDDSINFNWQWWLDPCVTEKEISIRWSAVFTPNVSGIYRFQARFSDGFRMFVNETLVDDHWSRDDNELIEFSLKLVAGEEYAIRIECDSNFMESRHAILKWEQPIDLEANSFSREVAAAERCETAVVVIGLDTTIECEGLDRATLELPPEQTMLVEAVVAANPNTIVILEGGSAMAVTRIHEIAPAILLAWYPGQEGGAAIVDMISGKFNPSGRLPLTFYKSLDDLPPFDDYEISNGKTYMHLMSGEPLYPFGYGMSYTSFEYHTLEVEEPTTIDDQLLLEIEMENCGVVDGDEVAQVYISKVDGDKGSPIRKLAGFLRKHFKAGERKRIEIPLRRDSFMRFDETIEEFILDAGEHKIEVGASSSDIRLSVVLPVS